MKIQRSITKPGWPCTILVVGEHLVVQGVTATWFGGTNDPHDNGQTASGISTRPKGVLGCALPIPIAIKGIEFAPTAGSPFPRKLPWRTQVVVRSRATGKAITVPLIDRGPSKTAASDGDIIDLTPTAFKAIAANSGREPVDFVILNGARYHL